MTDTQTTPRIDRATWLGLVLIVLVYTLCSVFGITWGLPGRSIDKYLFGDRPAWSGEKIYRLAGASEKFNGPRGADVDQNPLDKSTTHPIPLTATDADIAKILLRYRLYTYQPDEMITMMALARMKPHTFDFDPRLYQYGGLFLYPVGAIIKCCGLVGIIELHSNVAYYLDHPDEFAKFYVVARAYAAAWGILGVLVVFFITRRLANLYAAFLAALLFALMPVVVCMAHEGKPHLPGAVLMLLAVLLGMRALTSVSHSRRDWWLMCICCGAALGMVLTSWPIFVLIPLIAYLSASAARRNVTQVIGLTLLGSAVGLGVYCVTNPYIVINALTNQKALHSNFGNSLAMYEIARVGEGFIRVLELTVEGVTWPVLFFGVVAAVVAVVKKRRDALPLLAPSAIFFLQFVVIGAGKPAEYGRFGIFTDATLAVAIACLVYSGSDFYRNVNMSAPKATAKRWSRHLACGVVLWWVSVHGASYLWNFHADATGSGSRTRLAQVIHNTNVQSRPNNLTTTAEPAPYCFPPIDFARKKLWLIDHLDAETLTTTSLGQTFDIIGPMDTWESCSTPPTAMNSPHQSIPIRSKDWPPNAWFDRIDTPISWANKPFRWWSFTTNIVR